MNDADFDVVPFDTRDRSGFCCGVPALDRYFQIQIGQDIRRDAARAYLAVDWRSNRIAGYYTLAAAEIPLQDLPESDRRRLPQYTSIPAVRLGRLAVDVAFRARKLGSVLLFDAAQRAHASGIGVFALIVDAKNSDAAAFYQYHGLTAYGSAPNQMFAPLKRLLAP